MATKVEGQHGQPVADGCGRGIWCRACNKLQPLHKAFDLWAWNKHVNSCNAHKAAVRALEDKELLMANWGAYA